MTYLRYFHTFKHDFHPLSVNFTKLLSVFDIFGIVKIHSEHTFSTSFMGSNLSYTSKYGRKSVQKQVFWILNPLKIFEGKKNLYNFLALEKFYKMQKTDFKNN